MKNLAFLIHRLTKAELKNVKQHYHLNLKLKHSKRKALLDFVLKNGQVSNQDACMHLYGTTPSSKFSELKKGLRQDILNIMLVEEGKNKYEIKFLAGVYDCRKKIIQAQILKSRGLLSEFDKTIREALDLAEKFELHPEALTCVQLLLDHLGTSGDYHKYTYYSELVDKKLNELINMLKAKKMIYLINMPQQEHEFNSDLREKYINDIQNLIELSGSDRVRYNYLQVMFQHFYKMGDFELAKNAAQHIQELYLSSQVFYSSLNIAGSFYNIALTEARLGNYTESLRFLKDAVKPFNINSINALNIKTNLLSIYLNLNEYDHAEHIQVETQHHRVIRDNPYGAAALKLDYYKAYILFVKGKYQDAIIALHKCDSLDKLNKTWYWASLLLEVQILMERELYDIATTRLTGLKRKIARVKVDIPRLRFAIKALSAALKDHGQVKKNLTAYMSENLKSANLPPSNLFGYEIISFEKWAKKFAEEKEVL